MTHGHIVLVLGFHRSGTSLVAKSLECLGVELGPMAEWSAPDNPKGFWEDRDVLAFDQRLMQLHGANWASLGRLYEQRGTTLIPGAINLLRQRLAAMPLWGLKEPRLCRLLSWWAPLMTDVAEKVSVVHVTRDPDAVAASLAKRNGMPVAHAYALRDLYEADLARDLPPEWPIVHITYEDMVVHPRGTLLDMANALSLPFDFKKATDFATHYVETKHVR